MHRRDYLTGFTVGLTTLSGCLNFTNSTSSSGSSDAESEGADAPDFETDENAPETIILLRQQPQDPNGISASDEFEIGVVLGNAGGEPVADEVSVELLPPNDDEDVQTATIDIYTDDELPSGAARFFTAGPFKATVAGDWELIAGAGIERVHPDYDGIVEVQDRP